MEFLQTWIDGYRNQRVQRGLDFAKEISERKGEYGKEAYTKFESAIRECQQGNCPYTVFELREMSDNISPGLGCVGIVWDAAKAVGNKN